MNNLSNFNIENLFSTTKSQPQFCGQLDIKTLFQTEDNSEIEINPTALLNTIHEKRNKLEKCYVKIFHKCWQTIESANRSGFTKIKYEIPKFSECIGYSCKECLLFLKNKLEELRLDVKINGEISLLISWEMLEDKIAKEKHEKEQKQKNFKSDFF